MDIPDWLVWIAVVLVVFQALALVRVIGLMTGPDLSARSKARLDLLETVGTLLLLVGLLLGYTVAESWSLLGLAGFVLITAGYVWKGVRLLRDRRRPTA
ncbi:hypothetical protein [Streptomyces sp. NPDC046712]|uniref:hypothetical protein n=1 Tax=Streptomyces sp. NPDC046712 TaxID=3154802 RepID=UPI0033F1D7F8